MDTREGGILFFCFFFIPKGLPNLRTEVLRMSLVEETAWRYISKNLKSHQASGICWTSAAQSSPARTRWLPYICLPMLQTLILMLQYPVISGPLKAVVLAEPSVQPAD